MSKGGLKIPGVDLFIVRETSPQVKLLAGMTLPPLVRQFHRSNNDHVDGGRPAASTGQD